MLPAGCKIDIGATILSGKIVIEALNIHKKVGDTCLVNNLSLRVMRGDRVGFIGPNGVGKTTLIKMLMACNQIGGTAQWFQFDHSADQHREILTPIKPYGTLLVMEQSVMREKHSMWWGI